MKEKERNLGIMSAQMHYNACWQRARQAFYDLRQSSHSSRSKKDLSAVDDIVRYVLSKEYRVGDFRENEALLEKANQYLRERYPDLSNKHLVQDLLNSEEINEVIDETVIKTLAQQGKISVRALRDKGLLESTIAYLAKRHPDLATSEDFGQELLHGKWADEVNAAIKNAAQVAQADNAESPKDSEDEIRN